MAQKLKAGGWMASAPSLVLPVCWGWCSGSFRSTTSACCIGGCGNPWPLASEPCLPSSGGNGEPGIHYWMSRSFAIAPYLWPSQPDYWLHWSSGRPFTTALFPANRAKVEPDLGDSSAHADDGCRRGVRTRSGRTDGQDRTEKGHCGGTGAHGGR